MKRIILILTALLLFATSQAQIGRFPFARTIVTASNKYTDDFESYSTGNLGGQGNWVAVKSNMLVADESGNAVVKASTSAGDQAVRYNATFSDNQYAKVRVATVTTNTPCGGVAVRCSGSGSSASFYNYYTDAGTWVGLYVNVDNTEYEIATGTRTVSSNDTMEIRINGTTITCLFNGSVDTSLGAAKSPATGNNGVYTDTRLSTGTPGVSGWGNGVANGTSVDNWEGGNL